MTPLAGTSPPPVASLAGSVLCLSLIAVTATLTHALVSQEAVRALFSRPALKSPSGRILLTTLSLTFYEPQPSANSSGRMLFVPWYLGDAAVQAAVDFCNVGVDGLPLSFSMGACVSMLEGEFVKKAEEIAVRTLDMAEAVPSLEPFKLPSVGLLDSMVGELTIGSSRARWCMFTGPVTDSLLPN